MFLQEEMKNLTDFLKSASAFPRLCRSKSELCCYYRRQSSARAEDFVAKAHGYPNMNPRRNFPALHTLILLFPFLLPAAGDTITFQNNKTIRGTALQTNGESVLVLVDYGTMRFSTASLKRIRPWIQGQRISKVPLRKWRRVLWARQCRCAGIFLLVNDSRPVVFL